MGGAPAGNAKSHPTQDLCSYSMEDYVTQNAKLYFSYGTELSPGGALTGNYVNGIANLICDWNMAININEIERIEIGDTILWKNK